MTLRSSSRIAPTPQPPPKRLFPAPGKSTDHSPLVNPRHVLHPASSESERTTQRRASVWHITLKCVTPHLLLVLRTQRHDPPERSPVMSRIKSLVATAISALILCFSVTPAYADTNTDDLSQALPDGVTVQVTTTDPEVLAQRALTLRQSTELMRYLATQTDEGIQAVITNTRGMKFVPDSSSNLGVKLAPENTITSGDFGDGPSLTPQAIPTCAKGWAAAWEYFAANAMACGASTVAGGVPGVISEGVFFAPSLFPDFNAPCRKK
ncbi:hypothetical protein SAMN04487766_11083 [Actinomyces ruminicola]|uniref:Uncharacterized protein n=1 Tax=Actinomyces ruminicola TaxID=332524 RepID=A0A1G9XTM4_9ACTO|nr:hypothetical protein SAMN04487766_11083 [Actinomyces ruminicola]